MPDLGASRHTFRHVAAYGPSRPSARALDRRLRDLNYEGPRIEWGFTPFGKGQALRIMSEAGVPTPRLFGLHAALDELGRLPAAVVLVGRSTAHRAGSGFWLCRSRADVLHARARGASHWLEYIHPAREFRVHIVHGLSVKLTEKLCVGCAEDRNDPNPAIRSHAHGWLQMSPRPDAHRVSLREAAKAAVAALGASHGAVDILLQGARIYVLEVNAAPALTDPGTDTLDRYAQAFLRHARQQQGA